MALLREQVVLNCELGGLTVRNIHIAKFNCVSTKYLNNFLNYAKNPMLRKRSFWKDLYFQGHAQYLVARSPQDHPCKFCVRKKQKSILRLSNRIRFLLGGKGDRALQLEVINAITDMDICI